MENKNPLIEYFNELEDEILFIKEHYNMHEIEIRSIINKSIKQAYELSDNYIVSIVDNITVLIYNMNTKRLRKFSLRKKNIDKFEKNFYRSINKKQQEYEKIEISNFLKNTKYFSIKLDYTTRRYAYFTINDKNISIKTKYIYKYQIKSKLEKDFIESKKIFFIKSNKSKKTNEVDIFNTELISIIAEKKFKEIYHKSRKKLIIEVEFIDRKQKLIGVVSNLFLPKKLIDSINVFFNRNYLYNVKFEVY